MPNQIPGPATRGDESRLTSLDVTRCRRPAAPVITSEIHDTSRIGRTVAVEDALVCQVQLLRNLSNAQSVLWPELPESPPVEARTRSMTRTAPSRSPRLSRSMAVSTLFEDGSPVVGCPATDGHCATCVRVTPR